MTDRKNDTFLNPYDLVQNFDLKKGMKVADFGSGAGHFSLAIARIIGQDGALSAIDIRVNILDFLIGQARLEGLVQISPIQGNLEEKNGSTLNDESQDAVLISNLLHQVKNIGAVLDEAMRVLKKGGKLFVVDWLENSPLGPQSRIAESDVEKEAKDTGFSMVEELEAGTTHYCLVFKK